MDQAMRPLMVMATTNDQWQDQRMHRWSMTMVESGWKVHWIGIDRGRHVPLFNTDWIAYERLKIVPSTGLLFYAIFNWRLFCKAMSLPAHAFLAVDADTLPGLRLASIFRWKPLWFDAHEWFTEVPELLNRPITRIIWHLILRLFLQGNIQCYTVGPELASHLRNSWGKSFQVLRNMPSMKGPKMVDPNAEFQDSLNTRHSILHELEGPYLLYQGALNMGRGLESLIEAADLGLPFPLVMAGSGDLEGHLHALIRSKNLENKVILTGPQSPHQLRVLTKNAFLGFNLLETRSLSYKYSLANKFFDYIHAGIPQVCIDFPEYRHHMNSYRVGWLIEDTEPSSIIQQCKRIIEDSEDYQAMRENCHQAAVHWNWENESAALQSKLIELRNSLQPIS